ncbi:hypothetical protein K1T71_006679 [Dendrolimus kikuchii]|uniref:Uncharacterized protein n=1 Tax=Dendrolimus kikuchii TaxID=765133 RepID=A0ACC1D1T3_9NEOP|nr:hypothetical protein K1T71_006679 [Dendrolimus kikuchii]
MTNKEDLINQCDPHYAGLLAGHLVGQIIDEAYVIVQAVLDSGIKLFFRQPWRYQTMLAKFRNSSQLATKVETDDTSFLVSKDDDTLNENKIKHILSVVATSTPQKYQGEAKSKERCNFIGQGDEDLDLHENGLAHSTSTFINHLFDMSDVEMLCDESKFADDKLHFTESNETFIKSICNVKDSYVNSVLGVDSGVDMKPITDTVSDKSSKSSERSAVSFMADAFVAENSNTHPFLNEINNIFEDELKAPHITTSAEVQKITNKIEQERKENVELYENTFLTLNRDYEQGFEDDSEPFLQEPKGLSFHEIELMTANTSEENLCVQKLEKEKKELAATTMVPSSATVSRKSTLARRCRIQGVKLLSCFKGWWRRKSPLKNKEVPVLSLNEGTFPLSPNARSRASSLLDNRIHRTSSPSRPVVWKFNTVTEALVHSSRWKDYTFEAKPEECEDCSLFV